jgi:hypothetical protein
LESPLQPRGILQGSVGILNPDDLRGQEWGDALDEIIAGARAGQPSQLTPMQGSSEPSCAWYCPIHFFGHGWGIYIRESCVLDSAKRIATFVDWRQITLSRWQIARQLLRSAFYTFFLHEQFHHKVESLGFRLLISTGADRYRPYKATVYRPSYLTPDCLEESLANAEIYRRLSEKRYIRRVEKPIRDGVRDFLKASMPLQPPGYAQGDQYLAEAGFRDGLQLLQSRVLDGALTPTTTPGDWAIAPNMITALTDITDEIYVVLPVGATPIFRSRSVDPGFTVSTRVLVGALTKHYGYIATAGGKGSHVKLEKHGAGTIVLPGNRAVLSPGIVKQALGRLGSGRPNGVVKFCHAAIGSRARSMAATTWLSMTRSAWRSSGTAGG